MIDLASDLELIRQAAIDAGALAVAEREAGLRIESKVGGSPVTSGDLAVDAMLKDRLLAARPDYGWLSEETADTPERLSKRRIFVVDPVDGTVAYMKRQPWWCVPIAVVEDGQVVAAAIHAPEVQETYAAARGGGAQRNGAVIRASDAETLDDASVLGDARMIEGSHWDEPWPVLRFAKRNALAYRMALVAA
ncbi:MAG: inositol monophosphatase family protein, partial [Brevundimonas mediterranea]